MPLFPENRIDHYLMAESWWDDFDFGDLFYCIERDFNFTCSSEEWQGFLGLNIRDFMEWESIVAPRLTFGALADFIIERAEAITFEPVSVAGHECGKAGAFLGVNDVARQVKPGIERIAPSTPIRKRLHGRQLVNFWNHLQWMTENSMPRLNTRWIDFAGTLRLFDALFLLIILAWGAWAADFNNIALAFASSAVVTLTASVIVRLTNPLPEDVSTFRDLAEMIATFHRRS